MTRLLVSAILCGATLATVIGCEPKQSTPKTEKVKPESPASAKPSKPKPSATPSGNELPPGHPPMPPPSSNTIVSDGELHLTGVVFQVPEGWQPADRGSGTMAPKAVFNLPADEEGADGVEVRITYFPGMKGMDDANIDRWIKQVRKADGSLHTREEAHLTNREGNGVALTIIDLTGSVSSDMMGGTAGQPQQRMIAAIVDHPQGPHFVKATGPAAAVEKWSESINEFLDGAKAE